MKSSGDASPDIMPFAEADFCGLLGLWVQLLKMKIANAIDHGQDILMARPLPIEHESAFSMAAQRIGGS